MVRSLGYLFASHVPTWGAGEACSQEPPTGRTITPEEKPAFQTKDQKKDGEQKTFFIKLVLIQPNSKGKTGPHSCQQAEQEARPPRSHLAAVRLGMSP